MPAFYCCKFQYTIIWVIYTLFIIHSISSTPYFLLYTIILQNFHCPCQHNALILKTPSMINIDTCFWILHKLLCPHGRRIRAKIKTIPIYLAWRKHGFHIWKTIFIYRTDKSCFLFLDKFDDTFSCFHLLFSSS